MREFLYSVITVSVITSLSLMICPEGSLKKYVRLALSLVFIAFVITSLKKCRFDEDIDLPKHSVEDMTDDVYGAVVEKTKENITISLTDMIVEKFNIKKEDISVEITVSGDYSSVEIDSVKVVIRGLSNALKVTEVKNYVRDRLGCDVLAVFEE